jgi:hypothetical protein
MSSVAAISSRDIWVSAASARDVIVKHRVGSSWRTVQTPRVKGQDDLLIAEMVGRNDIWAIGKIPSYSGRRDRIEHYHCLP